MADKFCRRCGTALSPDSNFCSQCGARIQAPLGPRSVRGMVAVLPVALVLWGIAWFFQSSMAGTRPTANFTQPPQNIEADAKLKGLQDKAESAKNSLPAWQELVTYLKDKLAPYDNDPTGAPPELTLELIDALSQVIRLDPTNKDALMETADISFGQQAFNKAEIFYRKVLDLTPKDNNVKAKHASTLSFLGKPDDAIKELNEILKVDPKNFHAHAYLSITYAQKGDKDKALDFGKKALTLAPNEEARSRFEQFVMTLTAHPEGEAAAAPGQAQQVQSGNPLEAYLKSHPIAGPKFVSLTTTGREEVTLAFRDFPMDMMPPFAKERFLNGIKEVITSNSLPIKRVVFVDADSRKELANFSL